MPLPFVASHEVVFRTTAYGNSTQFVLQHQACCGAKSLSNKLVQGCNIFFSQSSCLSLRAMVGLGIALPKDGNYFDLDQAIHKLNARLCGYCKIPTPASHAAALQAKARW